MLTCAGRETIIDQDDFLAANVQRRQIAAIFQFASFNLLLFQLSDAVDALI